MTEEKYHLDYYELGPATTARRTCRTLKPITSESQQRSGS